MRSLRTRLLVGTTLASAAVMAALAVAIELSMRRTLISQFNTGLASSAYAIAAMVEQDHNGVRIDPDALVIPEFQPGKHPSYFQVWVGGAAIARSPSLAGGDMATVSSAGLTPGAYRIQPTTLPNGRPGRLLTMSFHPTPAPGEDEEEPRPRPLRDVIATIAVAQNTHDLDDTLEDLRWLTIGLCSAATILSGASLVLVVTRATRPVRRLADQIGGLRETDLSTSIDARGLPSELTPVVDRLNGLLARLGAAFNRERAFTADVAHELRTPLAGLLATLEVCRQRPRDPAGYESAIDKSLAMLAAMQALVENLLLLARAEGGQLTLRPAEVDLTPLIYECWSGFDARAVQRRLAVTFDLPEKCLVPCDREFSRMVITNLLDNAVSYTNDSGRIRIALSSSAGEITFSVANSGNQLSPDDLPHVFERFWRKESARSQTGLHAGLGLSLCRRLMTLQNGRLEVQLAADEFRATAAFSRIIANAQTNPSSSHPS